MSMSNGDRFHLPAGASPNLTQVHQRFTQASANCEDCDFKTEDFNSIFRHGNPQLHAQLQGHTVRVGYTKEIVFNMKEEDEDDANQD